MQRLVLLGLCLWLTAASSSCGDDDDDGGGSDAGTPETCQTGTLDSPSSSCQCEGGSRKCVDGHWGECECPARGSCFGISGWECPPCEFGGEPRIFPCVPGEDQPTCECDDEDAGRADAG